MLDIHHGDVIQVNHNSAALSTEASLERQQSSICDKKKKFPEILCHRYNDILAS
jgi:hypothetical protein